MCYARRAAEELAAAVPQANLGAASVVGPPGPSTTSAAPPAVTEVDGLQLNLSSTNATGYKGVTAQPGGRRYFTERYREAAAWGPLTPFQRQR